MNCLYETVAGAYIRVRSRFVPAVRDDLGEAEEALEACRANLASKERDAVAECTACTRAAIDRRKAGDIGGLKYHLKVPRARRLLTACAVALLLTSPAFAQERVRAVARLNKVRNGLALINKQLDALHGSTIDKDLMNSLRASSQAMKRAGIGMDAEEAEKVMNDLEDQIHEASEVTNVLATPLNVGGALDSSESAFLDLADVDAELGLLEQEDSELLRELAEGPVLPDAPSHEPEQPAAAAAAAAAVVVRAPPAPSAMDF
jgi:hypothetical protein